MNKPGNNIRGYFKGFFAILFLTFSFGAFSQNYGYILTITNSKTSPLPQNIKSQSITEVQKCIIENTGLDIDLRKIFSGENQYFEYRRMGLFLRCEKKAIEKRADGTLAYRKIRQKELRNEIFVNNNDQMANDNIDFGEEAGESDTDQQGKPIVK